MVSGSHRNWVGSWRILELCFSWNWSCSCIDAWLSSLPYHLKILSCWDVLSFGWWFQGRLVVASWNLSIICHRRIWSFLLTHKQSLVWSLHFTNLLDSFLSLLTSSVHADVTTLDILFSRNRGLNTVRNLIHWTFPQHGHSHWISHRLVRLKAHPVKWQHTLDTHLIEFLFCLGHNVRGIVLLNQGFSQVFLWTGSQSIFLDGRRVLAVDLVIQVPNVKIRDFNHHILLSVVILRVH